MNLPIWIAAAEPDPSAWVGLIVFVVIAVGVSFVCSILEAVLLSVSSSYLEVAIEKGSRAAIKMRSHKEGQNIDRSISAILTLNTIAHTVGAAGVGAQALKVFGEASAMITSAVLVVLVLVVSEIIPKTIGAVYWRALMPISAHGIGFLVMALYPIVWSCQWLTDLLKPEKQEPTVTRAELEILARVGHQEGTLGEGEKRVVRNLMRLDEVQVKHILTPRTVLFALEAARTVDDVLKGESLIFSRVPIFEDDRDKISSYVLRFHLLEAAAKGRGAAQIREFARPIHHVPSTMSCAQLLETLVSIKEHLVLVVDEYGGTEGIVTLEDAIESLLGLEITDETDVTTDMQELARQRAARRRHTEE